MSYKFSTGSVRKGDIYFEDDREGEATYIDFGQDTITLRPSGSQIFHVTSASVGIGTTNPTEMLTIHGPVEPTLIAIIKPIRSPDSLKTPEPDEPGHANECT